MLKCRSIGWLLPFTPRRLSCCISDVLLCRCFVGRNSSCPCFCSTPSFPLQWFCDSEPVRHARAGIKAGMGLGDAFIRGILGALRNKLLWDLRRKARVAVAEAAMVMGVADDYGDLEYGQIFLQVSDEVWKGRAL